MPGKSFENSQLLGRDEDTCSSLTDWSLDEVEELAASGGMEAPSKREVQAEADVLAIKPYAAHSLVDLGSTNLVVSSV